MAASSPSARASRPATALLRRPALRLPGRPRRTRPAAAGADRRRDGRPRRPARVRAHAPDARAAHPAREGDLEHHHQPDAARAVRPRLPGVARPDGLRDVGQACLSLSEYAKRQIGLPPGVRSPGVQEFAVRTRRPAAEVVPAARKLGVHPGMRSARDYQGMEDVLLVCGHREAHARRHRPARRGARRGAVAHEADLREVAAPAGGLADRRSRRARRPKSPPSSPAAAAAAAGVRRARAGAPLHRALDPHVRDRHRLLPARLVHDEVQPPGQRAAVGLPGLSRPAPATSRTTAPRVRSS